MLSTQKNERSNVQPSIDDLIKTGYQHGFVSPIEFDAFLPGLSEGITHNITAIKTEPVWDQHYNYIIELGNNLGVMPQQLMVEQNNSPGDQFLKWLSLSNLNLLAKR